MMSLGDFRCGATVRLLWDTAGANGASITRATNGTVSIYKDNGTTQSTTGVSDVEDFDSLTGIHALSVDTSADASFYSAGSEFFAVLSAATIDGQTVNAVLGHFSLERNFAFMGIARRGTAQSATATTLVMDTGATFADNTLTGATVAAYGATQGYWQVRRVLSNTLSNDTLTVDAWSVTPSGTISYIVFMTPPDSFTGTINANVTQISGDSTAADNLEAALDGTGGVTITAALTGNITGNLSGSVGSVTGAVGSVTALGSGAVDDVWDDTDIETGFSPRESMRLHNAALAGKASGLDTTTATYRNLGDSKNVITATVTADGNRTAVTRDVT